VLRCRRAIAILGAHNNNHVLNPAFSSSRAEELPSVMLGCTGRLGSASNVSPESTTELGR